jgi:polar amino acid transport system substrate-binding protein
LRGKIKMKNSKFKKVLALMFVAIMILSFTGCSGSAQEEKALTKIEKIKESGKLVLGTAADYPPYEFHKVIDGEDTIVGFDIDIAKAIADDLGVELEIMDMKFDGLLPALVADKIDIIVAGMVPTEERSKTVDFTNTYYNAEQSILIKAEDKDKYLTKADIEGLVIGAQKATIQEDIAKSIEGAEVKLLSKITDLVLELDSNRVDGIILVKPVATAYANSNPNFFVPEISYGVEDGVAAAINKGNEDLLEAVNVTLDKLMSEGAIDKFIDDATKLAEQE